MSSRQIRAVFFDAAGTLFTVNGSVGEIYARLARAHGKDVGILDLEAGFRQCFPVMPPMAFPEAQPAQLAALEKDWWRDLVQRIFAPFGPFPRFAEYFDELFAFFARPEVWRLYPETAEMLTTLTARNLQLGVISNFDSRLFGLLEGLGIARFFDPVVISTRAGYAKPAIEIFAQALAPHSLRPNEVMYVGDNPQTDIAGADAAGLMPVLVDRRRGSQDSGRDYRVKSLAELPAVIDRISA